MVAACISTIIAVAAHILAAVYIFQLLMQRTSRLAYWLVVDRTCTGGVQLEEAFAANWSEPAEDVSDDAKPIVPDYAGAACRKRMIA
eukprot:3392364-Amphidinium_carterae.2